jgi:Secretion system C-terminal sorting domain
MAVLTAANGCDSTVTLTLAVGPFISTSFQATICEGESFNFGGQNLTVPGSYQSSYTALGDCDSTSTLNLIVLQNIESQVSATICSGESYPFNGQNPIAPGTYQAVLTAANGCDSTVTLNLSVLPSFITPLAAAICEGESYSFNGQGLSTAGVYEWLFTAINGCDSIVTLTLEVLPNLETNLDVQICAGTSFSFGDQIITVAGVYEGTFPAANGCDSIVTLTLNIAPAIVQSIAAEICQGETYAFGGGLLTQSGDYEHTTTAAGGCDSTTLLHLVVKPEFVTNLQVELVEGDFWNGVPIFNNTTIEEHYIASNGCDSTVFVQITVLSDTHNPLGKSYDLLIFPNPFDASATIELKGIEPGKSLTFKLLDVTGRLVQQRAFRSPSLVFHREGLPSGLYFIKVETEDGRPVAVGRVVAK